MAEHESISSFPLCWPTGWKRAKTRKRADFGKDKRMRDATGNATWKIREQLSVADAVDRLLATLRRMGVPDYNVIISTNVQVRLDGRPYSNQRDPQDPGVAVYWRKGTVKERKCMAVDQYDRVADNIAAVAATLEAMRAIDRYGGAEILERAFLGFQALPPPMSAGRPWQDVLGLTPEQRQAKNVRAIAEDRFRELAHKYHPDHSGGDAERFSEISEAIRQARADMSF